MPWGRSGNTLHSVSEVRGGCVAVLLQLIPEFWVFKEKRIDE
jgi:hypothetical protein